MNAVVQTPQSGRAFRYCVFEIAIDGDLGLAKKCASAARDIECSIPLRYLLSRTGDVFSPHTRARAPGLGLAARTQIRTLQISLPSEHN